MGVIAFIGVSSCKHQSNKQTDKIVEWTGEVPARSHKPNYGGSIPSSATNKDYAILKVHRRDIRYICSKVHRLLKESG